MKLALMGAVATVTATFATAALAQAVTEDPGHRAQFYSDSNGQTTGSGNPRTFDDRYWQGWDAATMPHADADEPDRYRYHGGPKSND